MVVAAAASSCASYSTLTTARMLAPGELQFGVAPGAVVGAHINPTRLSPDVRASLGVLRPDVEVSVRRGFSSWAEAGLKLHAAGALLDAKVPLLQSDSSESGLDLAGDVSFGLEGERFFGGTNAAMVTIASAQVALIAGWNVGWGSQVVLAPRFVLEHPVDFGQDAARAGATLGFAWRSESITFFPQLSAMCSLGPNFRGPPAMLTLQFVAAALLTR